MTKVRGLCSLVSRLIRRTGMQHNRQVDCCRRATISDKKNGVTRSLFVKRTNVPAKPVPWRISEYHGHPCSVKSRAACAARADFLLALENLEETYNSETLVRCALVILKEYVSSETRGQEYLIS